MVKIMNVGIGTGKGEYTEVFEREKIERIIDEISLGDAIELAYQSWIPQAKNGFACISLKDGELFGCSLSQNESNQAVDNCYIIIYKISSYQEFDADEKDKRVEELEFNADSIYSNNCYIKSQLDKFYNEF